MITKTSRTWLGTIIVASIFLALALMGGTWGTSYAAHTNEAAAVPVIFSIAPVHVMAGTGEASALVIKGLYFGADPTLTHVRLYQWIGTNYSYNYYELLPSGISDNTIYVDIPAILTGDGYVFDVVVVKYTVAPGTPVPPTEPPTVIVPTVPTIPVIDGAEKSNAKTFRVYINGLFLPLIPR